ncbi:uncharacterized protein LOC111702991 [Eurytemora carolleeae]|uniref:uncharacterized protein LOC111702991 n=1 Tax=Eurytemora carolleeae TaxID=1294199 RepID=UPI000C777480|nr:uncharacterized protein LOC111702991 [Eurytemora carolleeae]|eukprot:XP_023330593.1 uncharacterized protein LOC111702991 [Eurytemora affinis]
MFVCVYGYPQGPPPGGEGPLAFPRPGANGDYAAGDYFQYINVPAHKVFEWGYRRGNPSHNREQYLSQKDHTFKSKLKWSDAYGGHGEHYFDYNHGDSYKEPAPAYQPAPAYASEPEPVYEPAPTLYKSRR